MIDGGIKVYWLESEKGKRASRNERTSKEITVAELPQNPGSQGSPEQTGASAPPFQPVAAQYQQVVPPVGGVPQPVAAPAKSGGGGVLKIILIVIGVIVVLVMLVVGVIGYGIYRVAHAVKVNSMTGETTITTPGGSISANSNMQFTSSELGTDIYPGAVISKSGNLRMNIAGSSVVTATFLTSDAKEKVVGFYKDKLGSEASTMDFGANAILSLKKGEHEMVQVTISQEANQFDGKTQIHISHTTESNTK
jgi:hypothetical protein